MKDAWWAAALARTKSLPFLDALLRPPPTRVELAAEGARHEELVMRAGAIIPARRP